MDRSRLSGVFTILFSGNVGSSWLWTLLGAHPEISTPIYEPLFEVSDELRRGFLDSAFGKRSKDETWAVMRDIAMHKGISMADDDSKKFLKSPYLCIKARSNEVPDYNEYQSSADYLIWIRRRNIIKHALSEYKRLELGISQFTRSAISEGVVVDLEKFDAYIANTKQQEEYCAILYDTIVGRKLCIYYEDLLANPNGELRRVLLAMGLNAENLSSDYFKKVTSDDLRQAISNFDEVLHWAAQRGYEDHFH